MGWLVGGWMRRKGWCKCHLSKQQARRRKRDTRSERTQPEDEAGSGGRGGVTLRLEGEGG